MAVQKWHQGTSWAVHGHQLTKFGEDIPNSGWVMPIFLFFKMAAGRHLWFCYRSKMALQQVADCPCLQPCQTLWLYLNRRLSYCVLWKNSTWTRSCTANLVLIELLLFNISWFLKFCKLGLKCLFRPPKFTFLGVLTPKCYFSLLRPPKGTSLAENAFWAPLVAERRAVRPGRAERRIEK